MGAISIQALENRIASFSGHLFTGGLIACASLFPVQVRAAPLTGQLNVGLQEDLVVDYIATLTAHPQEVFGLSSISIRNGDTAPVWLIGFVDEHETYTRHGLVASWGGGIDLVDYVITPLVELTPECEANFSTCGPVSASTAISVKVGPGVTPGNNAASVTVNGNEVVPGPLPLLGVGAAFGYSRKLRMRINSIKIPEIMSAIT